ncbi:MAG TPA: carbohydrate ABC transporter permease [Anaerolineae bacterium]|nr:carbohydrate ABC transporter permease [Anaerolineae bacterium]
MTFQTLSRPVTPRRTRRWVSAAFMTIILAGIALIVFYPIALLIFTALKTPAELVRNTFGPPQAVSFNNIIDVWVTEQLGGYLVNSLIVSSGVVIGSVILSALGGFGFARLHFSNKRLYLTLLLLGLVIPFETLIIPIFYMMRGLNLLSTYWAMIIPQVALGLPFGILLVRSFTVSLPQELFDAAELDGCNAWNRFWHVALPLMRPALVAVAIFQAIWSWNQYLLPLVVVQDPNIRTLPLMLGFFIGRYSTDFGRLCAAALMLFLPTLVFYILFHRQILNARLTGALNY